MASFSRPIPSSRLCAQELGCASSTLSPFPAAQTPWQKGGQLLRGMCSPGQSLLAVRGRQVSLPSPGTREKLGTLTLEGHAGRDGLLPSPRQSLAWLPLSAQAWCPLGAALPASCQWPACSPSFHEGSGLAAPGCCGGSDGRISQHCAEGGVAGQGALEGAAGRTWPWTTAPPLVGCTARLHACEGKRLGVGRGNRETWLVGHRRVRTGRWGRAFSAWGWGGGCAALSVPLPSPPQVSLPGTNCACLRAVLEFLYMGFLVPTPDLDATELLVLANRLCLARLQALTGESLAVLAQKGGLTPPPPLAAHSPACLPACRPLM